jgi:hypothetical protein
MGPAYYFWESLNNARWWGGHDRYLESGYAICLVTYSRTESNTLDLHDNKIHREYLRTFIESLRMSGAIDITENTTLSTCLQYARKMTTQFQFSAVRMKHLPLKRNSSNHVHERDVLRLEDGRQTLWFDFDPLVQVGVFDLPILDMESFKLVERYCSEDEFI